MDKQYTVSWCHKGETGFEEGYRRALALRTTVFVEEQGFQTEADETDNTAYHLLVDDENELTATARIFSEDGICWHVGRVAVKQDLRKTGLGRFAMEQTEIQARKLGGKRIVLSAQERARTFYEKCGYQAAGEIYYDEFCPHIDMEKML